MKEYTIYRILLQKAYFERGNSWLSYLRYFSLSTFLISLEIGFIANVIYAFSAYVIGRTLYHKGIVEIENEISNNFNRLALELRKNMAKKK